MVLKIWESGPEDTQKTSAEGMQTLVFVHGWSCSHETMQPLVDLFKGDHHCISVDLLGHGQSPASKSDYSIAAHCDAIGQTLGPVLPSCCVIGHSMGGQIALELATRKAVSHAVLLDPAPIMPHAKAALWTQDMRRTLKKVDVSSMMAAFARNQFVGPVAQDMAQNFVDTMAATDPSVVRAAWEGIAQYDGAGALAKLGRPTLVISADKPLNDMRAMIKASPHIHTAQTAGSGHMQQLEVPDQLNVMIRRFLHLNVMR